MNTLQISNKLTELGMDKPQSDFIAQTIDEKNQELATRKDIKDLRWLTVVGFTVTGVGFGYVVSILNTIISKLA
ncbi:hypothetical protein [Candidatus Thioglobus sp.]|uniref:hypothetical protein n=1 Tax=Candidatus Thioglobus sp. TaxID=2026721 RepID=UPI003D147F3D